MNQKKQQAGAHPFYQGTGTMNYNASELKGRGQAACAQSPAAQMVHESSDARPQIKIDPLKDPLLTGSQKAMDNPLEVIGGKGTQVVAVQQDGKTENIICEESGEDSLETCTRDLTVRIKKFKIRKEWDSDFSYGKCCNAERYGHYLPCQDLRKAMRLARRTIKMRARSGPPPDTTWALEITAPYKACMAELKELKRRGCGGPFCYTSSDLPALKIKLKGFIS